MKISSRTIQTEQHRASERLPSGMNAIRNAHWELIIQSLIEGYFSGFRLGHSHKHSKGFIVQDMHAISENFPMGRGELQTVQESALLSMSSQNCLLIQSLMTCITVIILAFSANCCPFEALLLLFARVEDCY